MIELITLLLLEALHVARFTTQHPGLLTRCCTSVPTSRIVDKHDSSNTLENCRQTYRINAILGSSLNKIPAELLQRLGIGLGASCLQKPQDRSLSKEIVSVKRALGKASLPQPSKHTYRDFLFLTFRFLVT